MYFATDLPHSAQVAAQLAQLMREKPALSWYALVDGAFDHGVRGTPLAAIGVRDVTYASVEFDALRAASPYLMALGTGDETALLAQITALMRHRRERPMLSFIGSDVSATALNENFRHYASASTTDGDSFMLRFADTRVLPSIAAHLRPATWAGITRSIRVWHFIDRDGSVNQVAVGDPVHAGSAPFELSDAEVAALVDAAEPDAVIHAIERSNPEVLPEQHHAHFYGQVAEACRFARAHGVDAFPDIVAIATYTALMGTTALEQRAFIDLIHGKSWQRGALIDVIADFADEAG